MTGTWDDALKKVLGVNPEDFVHWLFREAIYEGEVDRELPLHTIHTDFLLAIVLNGIRCLLHIEFQRKPDTNMAERLLEYNVQATRNDAKHRPVYSCVIYLKPHESMPTSPLIKTFPNGEEILRFNFRNIKPWEYTVEELTKEGLPGLLLFLPLTKDGAKRDTIEAMVTGLFAAKKQDILYLGYMVAALVFENEADLLWLKERFAMLEDILSDTWAYQEVFQKGELLASRQAIITVTQARFAGLVPLVSKNIETITDLSLLQKLLLNISVASKEQDVTQALFDVTKNTKQH